MCYEYRGLTAAAQANDKEQEDRFRKEVLEPVRTHSPDERRHMPQQERMPANRPLEEVEAE